MGARNEIYVDPSIAGNSGTGTIGDPYGDLQYALDQTTQGTDGDNFNIKAGTAEVLTAALSLATYTTASTTQPLVFRGYTATAGDGGIGEISGGASVGIMTTLSYDSVAFIDMKIGNCGAASIVNLDNYCSFISCEIYGTSSSNPVRLDVGATIEDCYLHSMTGANIITMKGVNSRVYNCMIDASGISAGTRLIVDFTGGGGTFMGNCVYCNTTGAVALSVAGTYGVEVMGNSFFNNAAGTNHAILVGSFAQSMNCKNNIIEGWSGTGGVPIRVNSVAPSLFGPNVFYNNATNAVDFLGDFPIYQVSDVVATASLFTAPASLDFTITTEAKEAARPQVFKGAASSTNFLDAGACQREEGGGGGGVVTTRYGHA